MSLKFSFSPGESSHEHSDHSPVGAAPGIPLPFAGSASTPTSSSSVLKLRVSIVDGEVVCEALSGDGVSYARASISIEGRPLSQAVRSVMARAGAELPEPLLGTVTGVELSLDGREAEALEELGLTVSLASLQLGAVDAALQSRTGIQAGTPITLGG